LHVLLTVLAAVDLHGRDKRHLWPQRVGHVPKLCQESVAFFAAFRTRLDGRPVDADNLGALSARLERVVVVFHHALHVINESRGSLDELGGAGVHHVALALRGAVLTLKVVGAV
jgi:hypothetical protein